MDGGWPTKPNVLMTYVRARPAMQILTGLVGRQCEGAVGLGTVVKAALEASWCSDVSWLLSKERHSGNI